MVDFAGILKKTINAQRNVTPEVRERIYKRATETLENKFLAAKISQEMADKHRQILQNAITSIEKEYLAVEKQLLSSVIGWQAIDITKDNTNIQNSVLPQGDDISVLTTKTEQESTDTSLENGNVFQESSTLTLRMPDAEPVNMDTSFVSQYTDSSSSKDSTLVSSSKVDNFHIVSHIFSQALRRTNRLSIQRRIAIGVTAFASIAPLIIGIYLIGEYVFVSTSNQSLRKNIQVFNTLSKSFSVNRKLTQRLLEDGSEIDVGLDQMESSADEEGTLMGVTTDLQSSEQLGEAVFYQARTDYDVEKVATGSARWSLIKESPVNSGLEELAIQGDIIIPDEGLSLRLILRRNTDLSFPAAYIMDFIFVLSDAFSGQAISDVKILTFKASEQSIGQVLTRTVTAKIEDNFFLVALSGKHPFLDQNLQLMRELDWIRLVLTDKNGRINELTFAKGPIGEAIFNEVIGQWLEQSAKSISLGQKNQTTAQ